MLITGLKNIPGQHKIDEAMLNGAMYKNAFDNFCQRVKMAVMCSEHLPRSLPLGCRELVM